LAYLNENKGFSLRWLGLTGGLGTGKSTVSEMLRKAGVPVVDADRIAKEVVERNSPGLAQVVQAFGPGVLNEQGELDRTKMAGLVFSDTAKLQQLESILHPLVQAEVKSQRQWLSDQNHAWAVYDVPLLFEKNLQSQFDEIILVTSTEAQQYARVRARNGWKDDEIRKRIQSQLPLESKKKHSQHIIENNGSPAELEKKVATLVQLLNDQT
jgi:dephospho-CoA kinase